MGSCGTLRCKLYLPGVGSNRRICTLPAFLPGTLDSIPPNDNEVSVEVENGFTFNDDCEYLGIGRPGSIPFVSEKLGAYGRLLLAVYVRWKTGLLISSDWLSLVTRGAWRAVLPDRACHPGKRTQCMVRARPGD